MKTQLLGALLALSITVPAFAAIKESLSPTRTATPR